MVYVRGGKEGFDECGAKVCTGWDYNSVVPYFEKVLDQINILHGEKNDFILVLIEMDNISPIQRMKTR